MMNFPLIEDKKNKALENVGGKSSIKSLFDSLLENVNGFTKTGNKNSTSESVSWTVYYSLWRFVCHFLMC